MGREKQEQEFAADYVPSQVGGSSTAVGEKKEIAKTMPWLKPKELEAMRKEQERMEIEQQGERNFKDIRMTRKSHRPGMQEEQDDDGISFARYAPNTRPTTTNDSPKKSTNLSKRDASKGMKDKGWDEGLSAVALPGRRSLSPERVASATSLATGQFNQPGNRPAVAPVGSGTPVGAIAVEGPRVPSADRVERGEVGISRADQSLISAELVTDQNQIDPDDLREMLRSELQAELRNNIVQAEVLTPAPVDDTASSTQEEEQEPKPPTSRRRYCIIGAVLVFIVGAGAGVGGSLASTGSRNDGGDAVSNNVGAKGPQSSPTTAPSIVPVAVEPTLQASLTPAMQPSFVEGDQFTPMPTTPIPTASPTRPPTTRPPTTRKPTEAGETLAPSYSPSANPTVPPTSPPTLSPTMPPTTYSPTRPPTNSPTRPPTASPTQRPTATEPPTNAPTTASPTASPTREEIFCPTVFTPVCGSDGKSYSNACLAGAAGVFIVSDGPCPTPTAAPTARPTAGATNSPPTREPTARPTTGATNPPPTREPTARPTAGATDPPTREPSRPPTEEEQGDDEGEPAPSPTEEDGEG